MSEALKKIGDFLKSEEGKAVLAGGADFLASRSAGRAGQERLKKIGKKQKREGRKLYEAMLDKLRKDDFVSQAQRDVAEDTKQAAEAFIDQTRRRGEGTAAATIDALRSDPRMAALAPKLASSLESSLQDAELAALDKRTAADAAVADLEQKGKDFQRKLDMAEMQRGALAAEAGRQTQLQAMLNQAQAGPKALQSGLQTAITTLSALADPEAEDDDGADDTVTETKEKNKSVNRRTLNKISRQTDRLPDDLDLQEIDLPDEEFDDEDVPEGKEGMKTNGEFSHERNPKAIIDEDTGIKEGEVTGGELIFNPEQSESMESFIEKDDAEGLLNYMKDLLSKPQFQQ
tara:strand:- start:1152 stop:2186 length:1035 start_codon:yes stop_codon:yes gene_type:complete